MTLHFFRVSYIFDGPWYLSWLTWFILLALMFVYGIWYGLVYWRWNLIGVLVFGAVQITVGAAGAGDAAPGARSGIPPAAPRMTMRIKPGPLLADSRRPGAVPAQASASTARAQFRANRAWVEIVCRWARLGLRRLFSCGSRACRGFPAVCAGCMPVPSAWPGGW